MKRVLFIFCLGFPFIFLNAQIKVATNNNVGIGTSNPQSLLSVNSEGSSLYTATFHNTGINRTVRIGLSYPTNSNYNIALVGAIDNYSSGFKNIAGYFSANSSSTHSKRAFGVKGIAGNGASGYNYGVMGLLAGTRGGAGIVGTITTEPTVPSGQYAAFFYGNVRIDNGILDVAGTTYTSDIRLKRNVVALSSTDSTRIHTEKLKKLNAIEYQLVAPPTPSCDTCKTEVSMSDEFLSRKHIGISAQEIQKVYPELVSSNNDGYLSVNYVGLIPILIEALKEQEAELELMKEQLRILQEK